MKKLFFPVMLFAVAMSSCSEDETSMGDYPGAAEGEDLVSINVYAGTTKGSDTTTSTLEDSTYVELHIDDSGTISDTYTFTYASSDWSQTEADPVKWGDIVFPANFYSLHDGTAFGDLSFTDNVATYRDYTVSGESTTHKDLVFHASTLDAIPTGNVLSVYHKHALSKIHLYAATGTYNVYIAKATLVNVDGEGTVTITPLADDAASTDVGATWTNSDSNYDDYQYYYIGENAATALNSTTSGSDQLINSDTDAPLMIIPQTTTAITSASIAASSIGTESYVEVIYYMTNTGGYPIVGYPTVSYMSDASDYVDADQDITLYVKAAFPLGYTFTPNKEYDIYLGLGEDGSTGGILVEDVYVDKDGDPVKLTKKDGDSDEEVEIPEKEPGDDVLDGQNSEIDITVSVTTWDDGDSVTLEY